MEYSGILTLIGNTPSVSPALFETFVSQLIQHIAKEQGKTVESTMEYFDSTQVASGVDVVAPLGVNRLEGSTVISVKFKSTLAESGIRRELIKLFRAAQAQNALHTEKTIKSVLFIFSGRINKSSSASIRDIEIDFSKNAGIQVEIWDYSNLSDLVERNQEFVNELIPRLSTVHMESMVSVPSAAYSEEWKARRQKLIATLRNKYRENALTFFLGAGVSFDAGVPTWNQLLNDLFAVLVAHQMKSSTPSTDILHEIANRFVAINSSSPLIAGRYIRKALSDDFIDRLSAALYKNTSSPSVGTGSATLMAIAQMCIPKRTGPGVRSVITYNFDDLLEENLKKNHVQHHVVFRANEEHSREELPVYHVHGFLPRRKEDYTGTEESLLVFSEEGYHSLYRDPYFWANFIQLTCLRETSCLMVGLSLSDPNLRRILEIDSPQSSAPRHYAILQRMSYDRFINESGKKVVHASEQVVKEFLAAHHQTEENLYRELGVSIIWVEGFDEIPSLLTSLHS